MSESWKIENDLCRCCHSEGTHKKLGDPCLEGEEEIYSEMIHDTLDIDIKPVSGPLGSVTYTICEVCIMRLQDAWSFKQQVLQCERRFLDLYTRNVIKMEPDNVIVIDVKKETADSDNEGFKEERIEDDSGEDFPMTYDDGEIKSDDSMEVQLELRKTKPKPKPKAKPKAAPKTAKPRAQTKKVARPSTAKDAAMTESEQSEQKEKKGTLIKESVDFSAIGEGTEKKYRCHKCDRVTTRRGYILKHIRRIHLKKTQLFICDTCKRECTSRMNLLDHMRTHRIYKSSAIKESKDFSAIGEGTQKKYRCHKCDKITTRSGNMLKHIRIHYKEAKIFICDTCKKECTSRMKLLNHMRIHKLYKCSECKREFTRSKLKSHRAKEHGVVVTSHSCGICGYKGDSRLVLEHQRRVHMRERNSPCPKCDKIFFNKHALKMHMVRHNPTKEFVCKFCKKMFRRLQDLARHERIHTGDKRKKCKVCGARFVQKASLTYHIVKFHPDTV